MAQSAVPFMAQRQSLQLPCAVCTSGTVVGAQQSFSLPRPSCPPVDDAESYADCRRHAINPELTTSSADKAGPRKRTPGGR